MTSPNSEPAHLDAPNDPRATEPRLPREERGLEAAYKRHVAGSYMMPSGNIVPTGPTNPAWRRK